MAAMTYADLVQFLKDRNVSDSSARTVRNYLKIIQDANFALHNEGKFEFDRMSAKLRFNEAYSTGTVATSNGGPGVIGNGNTLWTSDQDDRWLRVLGNAILYQIDEVLTVSALNLKEDYFSDLADGIQSPFNYQITDTRVALPARFRDFVDPLLTLTLGGKLAPLDINELRQSLMKLQSAGLMQSYAVEWVQGTGEKLPYLWVCPSPLNNCSLAIDYYAWPTQPIGSGTEYFGIPLDAEPVLREFAKAFLLQEQNGLGDANAAAQMSFAKNVCRKSLNHFVAKVNNNQREPWTPDGDAQGNMPAVPLYLPVR